MLGLRNPYLRFLFILGSLLYILIMIKLLFLRGRFVGDGYRYNVIPLKTITSLIVHRDRYNVDTWVKNLLGNIVLFIPLGVIIPAIYKPFLKLSRFLACSLALLITVELIQLITRVGSFDVDDVILNMLGAAIGYLITMILVTVGKRWPADRGVPL